MHRARPAPFRSAARRHELLRVRPRRTRHAARREEFQRHRRAAGVKNCSAPPGAKNALIEARSSTRSAAEADDAERRTGERHARAPRASGRTDVRERGGRTGDEPARMDPRAGRRVEVDPISGGGKPPYSVPVIVYCTRSAAPAPRMLPVSRKPGFGTALRLESDLGRGRGGRQAMPRARQGQAPPPTRLLCAT